MASLLSSHLDQISLCSQSIADLPFPGPKIFTNALLSPNHDITALIRDTEQHERALFHLAPPPMPSKSAGGDVTGPPKTTSNAGSTAARRQTAFPTGVRQPKSKAVAAVLGGDLYAKTRREGANVRGKGDVDVEVLLEGAERLGAVYPIPGASEKIAALRRRHSQLAANISHYEDRVARNAQELSLMNRSSSRYDDEEDMAEGEPGSEEADPEAEMDLGSLPTVEDLRREEEEIRELERKKRNLEERVEGMGRDLGGLMR
ncbi:hypothetical protein KC340_g13990 [Hortaea werneckii]|nr:hypothetical protein KC342_g14274 [Hortaea werneckii]KAI7066572.1 hypothetical protein KC339_g15484 [Hortaea werneckii]KAI7218961.1 hypothetical protein KC365_g12458 [Hortaea werneckii]KAI7299055.1 hypothetical protein KC340_g13990 [Hortaea werneckii]KAI7382588.1 hypothetical protein KC328_g11694 [Hortaea werneckii]